MSTKQYEIVVQPTSEQLGAWAVASGDKPLESWLAGLADEASAPAVERTFPVVIKLSEPIIFGNNRTITELTMRRGQLGDLKGMKLGSDVSADQLILVASKMCGEQTQILERLAPEDSGEVMSITLDFFAKSLTPGKKKR